MNTLIRSSESGYFGVLKNTCFDLLWWASEAAALIRRSGYYDAVVHATANVLEHARAGGAVTGEGGAVIGLSGHHVERRVTLSLPFHHDCAAVAWCLCSNRC